jgi:hypothetical protein
LWFNVQQQIFHAYSELYKNIKYIEMKAGREIDATIFFASVAAILLT